MAIQEIRTNSNNRKIGPMEKDVITLETEGGKEDTVKEPTSR